MKLIHYYNNSDIDIEPLGVCIYALVGRSSRPYDIGLSYSLLNVNISLRQSFIYFPFFPLEKWIFYFLVENFYLLYRKIFTLSNFYTGFTVFSILEKKSPKF